MIYNVCNIYIYIDNMFSMILPLKKSGSFS